MIKFGRKIPISIHPFFWVVAALIGWFSSNTFVGTVIWVGVIVLSVLVHELGHATTAILFGQSPKIELIALGGLTSYEGRKLKYWQQFLITLDGPVSGIGLCLVATLFLQVGIFQNPLILGVLRLIQLINLFWSIVNLLPVLPLDGGQLLRIVLEAAMGVKGFRWALFIGMLVAGGISGFFFLYRGFLIGAIFFLFAFQSFDMWRRSKYISQSDREEENARRLKEGESALQRGDKLEAEKIFEEIRTRTKGGMLYVAATHYLALLYFKGDRRKEAYQLLLSVVDQLEEDAVCMLHELAFDEENYSLVKKLSTSSYQLKPTQDVALRNARAFAYLKEAKPAGGWLQTALQFGTLRLDELLSEKAFIGIKDDPNFKNFFKSLS